MFFTKSVSVLHFDGFFLSCINVVLAENCLKSIESDFLLTFLPANYMEQ